MQQPSASRDCARLLVADSEVGTCQWLSVDVPWHQSFRVQGSTSSEKLVRPIIRHLRVRVVILRLGVHRPVLDSLGS